ncbi:hypothetical protein ABLB84_00155 [Xenorhabdus szentirmaii]|uniref:hypothetical protein n=1 Tax=Xenorhabdus szentirmaii TaxID=290112 RepID=UPI0019828B7C|nr:hypothetical protein [Xenorhabdus sp. ZM]MBD2803749.1 hypothetical protein [Xenorhabdus sp. ZM]
MWKSANAIRANCHYSLFSQAQILRDVYRGITLSVPIKILLFNALKYIPVDYAEKRYQIPVSS